MTKGTITFYDRFDNFLFCRGYTSKKERAEFIQYIRRLYGGQFKTMYYQINPTLSPKQMGRIELPEQLKAVA